MGWQRNDKYQGATHAPCCAGIWTPGRRPWTDQVNDVQPVKLTSPEITQPSIVIAGVEDDSGCSVEDTLQFVSRLLQGANQETVSVVNLADDESMNESSGRVVNEKRQIRRIVVAAKRSTLNWAQWKWKIRCQQDSKNTDGVWCNDTGNFHAWPYPINFRKRAGINQHQFQNVVTWA